MKTSGKGLQRLPRKPEAHRVASELSLQGKKNTEIRSRLRSSRPATADCNALVPAGVKAPGAAGPGLAWQEPRDSFRNAALRPRAPGSLGPTPQRRMPRPIVKEAGGEEPPQPHPPTDAERKARWRVGLLATSPLPRFLNWGCSQAGRRLPRCSPPAVRGRGRPEHNPRGTISPLSESRGCRKPLAHTEEFKSC